MPEDPRSPQTLGNAATTFLFIGSAGDKAEHIFQTHIRTHTQTQTLTQSLTKAALVKGYNAQDSCKTQTAESPFSSLSGRDYGSLIQADKELSPGSQYTHICGSLEYWHGLFVLIA